MFLFVHIPKTAGTSFRLALAKYYGQSSIALDYGKDSSATSRIVKRYLYVDPPEKPRRALVDALASSRYQVLAGHFPLEKYRRFFKPGEMISFVRDPLHRTSSEFLHHQRAGRENICFAEYIELPRNQNLQSRLLANLPPRAFIGVTERADQSVALLNERLGTRLRLGIKNRAPGGGAQEFVRNLEPTLIDRFNALNERDIALYKTQVSRLEKRLASETSPCA